MASNLNKTEIRERFTKFGVWDKFLKLREQLKRDGTAASKAWELAVKQIEHELLEENRSLPELEGCVINVRPEDFTGKKATAIEELRWAVDNLIFDADMLNVRDAPSPTAIALWQWAKEGGAGKQKLFDYWSKTIPTNRELEEIESMIDDGRKNLNLIDQMMRELVGE